MGDYGVPVKDCPCLMSRQHHRHPLGHASLDHVPDGGPAKVVRDTLANGFRGNGGNSDGEAVWETGNTGS